jgi:hypothetical protein
VNEHILREIPGATDLLAWFEGRVPLFHDAEVVSVCVDRSEASMCVAIHTWEMTTDLDEAGYFIHRRHVVVSFELSGVTDLCFTGFNHQNIIAGLSIQKTRNESYSLSLEPCYGFSGSIEARALRVRLEPGEPPRGKYIQGFTRSRARPPRSGEVKATRGP